MENRIFRLRVRYRKAGRLAHLSHLEVTHALERTVRRAGLPFAISQGFSPHMKIAFGAALPVGVGGTAEIFDLQLTEYVAPAKVLEALQAASVPDLGVFECAYIESKAIAASVAFPVSVYEAELSFAPDQLVCPEEVTVVRKKTKTFRVSDYLVMPFTVNGATLRFALQAMPQGSLRPDILLRNCLDETLRAGGFPPGAQPEVLSCTRIEQRESL